MTAQEPPAFDEVASIFADYGTSLRGFVRYKLTQRNLEPFLTKKSLRVLDIGGGNGPDAAWLAQHGHYVTLLEPSQEQRDYAQRRFDFFLSEAARKRITIVPATLQDFTAHGRYDLVLVHGVAMYQTDPAKLIKDAVEYARPGGLVSIVETGYWGAEVRMVLHEDYEGLQSLQKTNRYTNNLHQEVHAFLPEELEEILSSAGTEVLEWSGIRVVVDGVQTEVAKIDHDTIDYIVSLEHQHGHNPAIRGQGRMLHFIARKKKT